jgi:hypothetical protein
MIIELWAKREYRYFEGVGQDAWLQASNDDETLTNQQVIDDILWRLPSAERIMVDVCDNVFLVLGSTIVSFDKLTGEVYRGNATPPQIEAIIKLIIAADDHPAAYPIAEAALAHCPAHLRPIP